MRDLDGLHWLIKVGNSIGETRRYATRRVGIGPSGESASGGLDLRFGVDPLWHALCIQLRSAVRVEQIKAGGKKLHQFSSEVLVRDLTGGRHSAIQHVE